MSAADRRATGTPLSPGDAVAEVDVDTDSIRIQYGDLDTARAALALVRRGTEVLDVITINLDGAATYARKSDAVLHESRAAAARTPPPPHQPNPRGSTSLTATVALCTLGKHPRLPESIAALTRQTHPNLQILVVDNDPTSGATRRGLSDLMSSNMRIIDQPRRGLSRARNSAIEACATDVLLFTDDDAIADPNWVAASVRAFSAADVHAVTGMVLPAELRTEAQVTFEQYGGFGKGTDALFWAATTHVPEAAARSATDHAKPGPRGPLFPYTAGKVGSGNNMAFRLDILRSVGGFDERLGAGTLSRGGEDLEAFSRVMLAGGTVRYTPDAVVWHYHRETMDQLAAQIRANGVGMSAILTKFISQHPRLIGSFARRARRVSNDAIHSEGGRAALQDARVRRRLLRQEITGLGLGPINYARSRIASRR